MISRLTAAFSSRLPSLALFSSMASSSNSLPAQIQKSNAKEIVEDIISTNKLVIFSKSYCPYCKRVKSLFEKEYPELKPAIFELDERQDGPDIQNYLKAKTGQLTVPSVFVNKTHVGGNDDTQEAFQSGKLTQLLAV